VAGARRWAWYTGPGGFRLNWVIVALLALIVVWQVRPWMRVQWIRPRDLDRWLAGPDPPVVADIRNREEYQAAHIRGAVSVPRIRIPQMSRVWSPDQAIVLVCRSSYREIQAYGQLRRRGFRRVYCLAGGMVAWAQYRLAAPTDAGRETEPLP
jgi:rhodanese-related sulfurtransferase